MGEKNAKLELVFILIDKIPETKTPPGFTPCFILAVQNITKSGNSKSFNL